MARTRSISHPLVPPRLSGSPPVWISVEPSTASPMVGLSSARELRLPPLFNPFGRYTCSNPVRSHTERLLHTSKLPLGCTHGPSAGGVAPGSDWISTCSAASHEDESVLEDPSQPMVSSLPGGHYWSASNGTTHTY